MSEMVERVSEALRKKFPGGSRPDGPASEDGNHDIGCYGDWARAAIEAMRDPPDSMADHPSYQDGLWSRSNIESFVDAALGKVEA